MRYLKKASIIFMVLVVCFFGILRSQQLDVYRDIARSQQQIMTVYKYLLTEYVHELDVPKLTSRIIKSMLENFDPYTEYYEEKDLEDLAIKTDGEFSGVGLQIYMYEDQLTVVGPIEGSPASRAGIFTGDEIMNIDGESTKGLELKEATNSEDRKSELGDVYFSLLNVSRYLEADPEVQLKRSIDRFINRARYVEQNYQEDADINELWQEAKNKQIES